jgi:hypothetical protein
MTAPLTPDERRLASRRHEPEPPEQVAERLRVAADRRAREAARHRQYRAALKATIARAKQDRSEEQPA